VWWFVWCGVGWGGGGGGGVVLVIVIIWCFHRMQLL